MEQFQVKGRTLVIRMPKELDHHTTGQIPGIADRMIGEKNIQRIEFDFRDSVISFLILQRQTLWTARESE